MPAIQNTQLSEEESFSFELARIWIELSEKYFPQYNHTHKKGGNLRSNPRKSIIFKTCYKLQRETKGLIEESDYPLYIRAQLEILKFQSKNNPLVLVEPGCLVGEKAWKRWKLWKKKYDAKIKQPLKIDLGKYSFLKAKEGILKTKKFLESKFPDNPSLKTYELNKENLINWLNFGNISPYYVALSPYMKKVFREEDYKKMNFDISFYQECINDEIRSLFLKLFRYEHS
ncbi:MAG: hypothetical protein EBU93_07580 [Chlamydiae bacterium]|nr:hypothetical protein [Chlamydiota bacterium]